MDEFRAKRLKMAGTEFVVYSVALAVLWFFSARILNVRHYAAGLALAGVCVRLFLHLVHDGWGLEAPLEKHGALDEERYAEWKPSPYDERTNTDAKMYIVVACRVSVIAAQTGLGLLILLVVAHSFPAMTDVLDRVIVRPP